MQRKPHKPLSAPLCDAQPQALAMMALSMLELTDLPEMSGSKTRDSKKTPTNNPLATVMMLNDRSKPQQLAFVKKPCQVRFTNNRIVL